MRYVVSYVLYWAGCAVSLIDRHTGGHMYGPYNWLMVKSSNVQGNGRGPWKASV